LLILVNKEQQKIIKIGADIFKADAGMRESDNIVEAGQNI